MANVARSRILRWSCVWIFCSATVLWINGRAGEPRPKSVEIEVVAVEFVGIPVSAIHFGANPTWIRANPVFQFRYRNDHSPEAIHEMQSRLMPTGNGVPYVVEKESYDASLEDGVLAVADFQYSDGTVRTIYVTLQALYNEFSGMKYQNNCEFREWYMRLSSFGVLSDLNRKMIRACE